MLVLTLSCFLLKNFFQKSMRNLEKYHKYDANNSHFLLSLLTVFCTPGALLSQRLKANFLSARRFAAASRVRKFSVIRSAAFCSLGSVWVL